MNQPAEPTSTRVKHVTPPVGVPVYNCLALVAPRNGDGLVVARAANLPGLATAGASEREALQKLVTAFKQELAAHHADGTPIGWLDPPLAANAGEQQRWLAVHL